MNKINHTRFAKKVLSNARMSYTYTIIDPIAFIEEARYLGKMGGSLELSSDQIGTNKPKGLLTVNDEEQERAIKVIETVDKKEAKEAYEGYMSTTLRSILSGGCLQDELVADLISLRFCKIQHVVNAHLLTTNKNVFTKIEKFNRVKTLQDYVSTETIPREGYGLQLVFDTKLIEIFSESNPDLIKVS